MFAFQIDSRETKVANSTRLSRTSAGSGPCSRGSIELVAFNTEFYGKRPGLEIVEYAEGYAAKEKFRYPCQSQPQVTVGLYSMQDIYKKSETRFPPSGCS